MIMINRKVTDTVFATYCFYAATTFGNVTFTVLRAPLCVVANDGETANILLE